MRFVVLPAFVLVASLVACEQPPVDWSDPVTIDQPSASAHLVVDGATARFAVDSLPTPALPASPGRCEPAATAVGRQKSAAAWWSVRPDSSAVLYLGASVDSGRTWGSVIPVDTSDVSSVGCLRPPPAVVTAGDDVYVAYSMVASEGTGVFFAHTMSGMLHSPVPVIYGERLVPTAIASDGQRVVVAYEEPNGTRRQIDLAISITQGHLFEMHTTASRSVDIATSPLVALGDSTLAVSWLTRAAADSTASRVVRVGRMSSWK
jgi:hypothetical protein